MHVCHECQCFHDYCAAPEPLQKHAGLEFILVHKYFGKTDEKQPPVHMHLFQVAESSTMQCGVFLETDVPSEQSHNENKRSIQAGLNSAMFQSKSLCW